MALSVRARPVDDLDIGDVIAVAFYERGREAMQRVEIRQCEIDLAPECLEAAPGIARIIAQHRCTNGIRNGRLEALEAAFALEPLAVDQAHLGRRAFERHDQLWKKGGIVLSIPIKRGDDRRAG